MINNLLTPVSDFITRLHSVVSVRLPAAVSLLKPLLMPFALRVVKQDAEILAKQTQSVRRFGSEQYVSTSVDLLGPHILRLLRQAERGDASDTREAHESRVELMV